MPSPPGWSAREEAVGEGSDEGDFDGQADDRLNGCDCCLRVTRLEGRCKDAPTMKGGEANDQRLVPGEGVTVCITEREVQAGER